MQKTGLVLEGGAMRGLFTSGVIDVMLEHHIKYDGMIGVSAGAAFGCNYKSLQIGRALRYCKRFAKEPRFCSLRSFLTTGDFFGGEFCYHTLPEKLDVFDTQAFAENPMEFTIVSTDIHTGKPVYHLCSEINYDAYEWIRASSSMPLASRIVTVDHIAMLDGGISDSIPLEYFENAGYKRNVVVLTQPEHYVKSPNSMMPLIKLKYRKYPKLIEAMQNRHIVYNQQVKYVAKAEAEQRAFVIRPSETLPIRHMTHDPELMQKVYDMGRETALKALPQLLEFLK